MLVNDTTDIIPFNYLLQCFITHSLSLVRMVIQPHYFFFHIFRIINFNQQAIDSIINQSWNCICPRCNNIFLRCHILYNSQSKSLPT